ncbi:hypothetical protein BE20_28935 [Sorangium cellulosum]|uniref:Uncharacterized protein n=1 Tax=Sorangium cellulosum TaxID=56 RepID=A0A150THA0_SORCE|nr:hypothetical protein BE20_28935 [Sorangium cellulosum]KYG03858.1 hypothetical protein BE18_23415 [Sorangium cellulosum]
MNTQSEQNAGAAAGRRLITQVSSLDSLIGAHPDALRQIYRAGKPADPAELGDAPRGRLLSLQPTAGVHLAVRPLIRALASDWMPWKGNEFDHGGNSGTNRVRGSNVCRFKAQLVPSELDGEPTLALTYGEKAFGNPWPVSALKDELRTPSPGLAIGPVLLQWHERWHVVLWFGLTRVDPQ